MEKNKIVTRNIGDVFKFGADNCCNNIQSDLDFADISCSSCSATISSTGEGDAIAVAGSFNKITSTGEGVRIASVGFADSIDAQGLHSASAMLAQLSSYRGRVGSWFSLTEWGEVDDHLIPIYMEAFYVDGIKIKEGVWYTLQNKKLIETTPEE